MKNKFRNMSVNHKRYRYFYNPTTHILIIEGSKRHIINTMTDERTKGFSLFGDTDKYGVKWSGYGSKNIMISPETIAMFIKTHNID